MAYPTLRKLFGGTFGDTTIRRVERSGPKNKLMMCWGSKVTENKALSKREQGGSGSWGVKVLV